MYIDAWSHTSLTSILLHTRRPPASIPSGMASLVLLSISRASLVTVCLTSSALHRSSSTVCTSCRSSNYESYFVRCSLGEDSSPRLLTERRIVSTNCLSESESMKRIVLNSAEEQESLSKRERESHFWRVLETRYESLWIASKEWNTSQTSQRESDSFKQFETLSNFRQKESSKEAHLRFCVHKFGSFTNVIFCLYSPCPASTYINSFGCISSRTSRVVAARLVLPTNGNQV